MRIIYRSPGHDSDEEYEVHGLEIVLYDGEYLAFQMTDERNVIVTTIDQNELE